MNSYFKEITDSYNILIPKIKKNSIYEIFCNTLIEQYKNIKIENFAFFMQVGSFYESYAWKLKIDNHEIDFNYKLYDRLSSILHMVKARKSSFVPHSISNPYMFGFPEKSKERHIDRLLNENMIVVLVHQRDAEDGSKTKIRDTIEILHPSTNINNNSNDNFTMCIALNLYKNYYTCGISLFNLNSNENYVYECIDSKKSKNNVKNKIYKINITYKPNEIIFYNFTKLDNDIISKNLDLDSFEKNIMFFDDINNKDLLKIEYQREYFKEIYNDDILLNNNLKHYNLNFYEEARLSFILLLDYISKINKLFLNNISKPQFIEIEDSLNIDYNTLDQLNIVSTEKKYEKFCLLEILDYTSTVMGKRFLNRRITNPLTNIEVLNLNYDISVEMLDNYMEFEKILNNIYDLARYHKKIFYQRISPQDLFVLFDNYEHFCKLIDLSSKNIILNKFIKEKIKKKKIEKIIKEFKKKFNLIKIKDINSCDIMSLNEIIFKKSISKDLDKFINKYNILKKFKKNKLIEIKTFFDSHTKGKYKFKGKFEDNSNYIKITVSKYKIFNKFKNTDDNMKDYFITQTGKSKFFLRSPILDEKFIQEQIIWDDINNKQMIIYKRFLLSLQKNKDFFHQIEFIIGFIDFIKSNVKVSLINKYSKPNIIDNNDDSFFDIKDFRHPIIEKINKDTEFVKNDLHLDSNKLGLVLTGDNGIGKSSLLKSIGICIIMAQSGMFVPCKSMNFFPFNNILTRIKGNDNIFSNSSSFQVEMIELCNILQKSNEKSLVLMDELCKGTEQASSHSLTLSVINQLVNKKKCKFIITTHMHSIFKDDLFKQLIETNKIFTKYMEVEISKGKIIYKRKLIDGCSGEIYGLEIARMLGINSDVINKAMTIRNDFLNISNEIVSTKKSKYNSKKYMTKCELCGKKKQNDLETHHIIEQKESNEDGFLENEMYHKNELFNLMVLCKKCHKKITFKKMKTSKKKLTSKGIIVEQI